MMKRNLLFACICLLGLSACKNDDVEQSGEVAALKEQFHGKYKLVQSLSSDSVDLNLDGRASTNMLQEITALDGTMIEVQISEPRSKINQHSHGFVHMWPKQELKQIESTGSSSKTYTSFTNKVVYWNFAFDEPRSKILLEPIEQQATDADLFIPPQSIKIKGANLIEVTLNKNLYTSQGWKTVEIVTLYERYYKGK